MIIAAYQGPSPEGDMVQAFRKINETLAQAAKQGAKMVVFPELYLLGYNQMHLHEDCSTHRWRLGNAMRNSCQKTPMRTDNRLG